MKKNYEFVVVDIETTGGQVTEDRITEIALYVHDGTKVIDSFHTLVNPEKSIPLYITNLTGITQEMVEDAPRFFEVAKKIVEITEGRILVAHNAQFDYAFIKQEFKSLGFTFTRKTLCTLRLSRKILPKLASYGLKSVCNFLQIDLTNHHRAQADAWATTQLLAHLLEEDKELKQVDKSMIDNELKSIALPPKIDRQDFDNLPEETGVYYFYNEAGKIIYVGKSTNIKHRIASHFAPNLQNRKSIEMKNQVASIGYELTGGELIALLLEDAEIKKHQPIFNRMQRRSRFSFGIFAYEDTNGYVQLFVDKLNKQASEPLLMVEGLEKAKQILRGKVEKYELCMKLANLYKSKGACFDYQIKKCAGACIKEEDAETYNAKVQKACDSFRLIAPRSFLIVGKGREHTEKTVVLVEKGRYMGFAYLDQDITIRSVEEAKDYIDAYKDNRDIQKIIAHWLTKHPQSAKYFL
jgi:DNA polymerase-3 subunit epsilon